MKKLQPARSRKRVIIGSPFSPLAKKLGIFSLIVGLVGFGFNYADKAKGNVLGTNRYAYIQTDPVTTRTTPKPTAYVPKPTAAPIPKTNSTTKPAARPTSYTNLAAPTSTPKPIAQPTSYTNLAVPSKPPTATATPYKSAVTTTPTARPTSYTNLAVPTLTTGSICTNYGQSCTTSSGVGKCDFNVQARIFYCKVLPKVTPTPVVKGSPLANPQKTTFKQHVIDAACRGSLPNNTDTYKGWGASNGIKKCASDAIRKFTTWKDKDCKAGVESCAGVATCCYYPSAINQLASDSCAASATQHFDGTPLESNVSVTCEASCPESNMAYYVVPNAEGTLTQTPFPQTCSHFSGKKEDKGAKCCGRVL